MSEDTKRTKAVDVKPDLETAADLADFFVARGKPQHALQAYAAVLSPDSDGSPPGPCQGLARRFKKNVGGMSDERNCR